MDITEAYLDLLGSGRQEVTDGDQVALWISSIRTPGAAPRADREIIRGNLERFVTTQAKEIYQNVSSVGNAQEPSITPSAGHFGR